METLFPLASALGLGVLAGARLYATVFAVGLLMRFEWMSLPAEWQHAAVLADTRVLIVAGAACLIEFVADKIPWVDSAWDSVHTFIRPIGAALLASSLFSNVDPVYQVTLFLLAGGVALSGHTAKAAARLMVNHSPEPVSNVVVSLAEDAAVVGGLYLLVAHPWVMAAVAVVVLLLTAWLAPRVCRTIRVEWSAFGALFRSWFGASRKADLQAAEREWLRKNWNVSQPGRLFTVVAASGIEGCSNRLGTLCLLEREAVFFSRSWGRLIARQAGPLDSIEIRKGLIVDELELTAADGRRLRFDLLAGQLASARDAAGSFCPSEPLP